MTEHYQRTIAPDPDEATRRLPGRSALKQLIEQCGHDPGDRRVLAAVLDLHWPESLGPDERPVETWVAVRLADLKTTAGLNRVPARDALRSLATHGYLELKEYTHRPPDVRPLWGRLVGVEASSSGPAAVEASTNGSEASNKMVEASGGLQPKSWRPPVEKPEASNEKAGGLREKLEASTAFPEASGLNLEASNSESEASDEPGEVAVAVLRVGNHLANVLREEMRNGYAQIVGALRDLAAAGWRPPEASTVLEASKPPLINESMNELNTNDSFINGKCSASAEASELEASAGRKKRAADWPGWPRDLQDIRADKLDSPAFVESLYQFVKRVGFWHHTGDDRLLFFATVIESIIVAKQKGQKPGGVLTNKIRYRDAKPASPESIKKARASLEELEQRTKLHPVRADPIKSELQAAMTAKQRQMAALPEPVGLGSALATIANGPMTTDQ